MNSENYTPVGKLGRPHGVSGVFRFYLYRLLKSKRHIPPYFFIERHGIYAPYFVLEFNLLEWDNGRLKFEEIVTPEQAKKYSGSELFLSDKDVEVYFKKSNEELAYLVGYTMSDKNLGFIGTILILEENPAQILAQVAGKNKEYLIPLAEDWVLKIDKRRKSILMELPDGLLDL